MLHLHPPWYTRRRYTRPRTLAKHVFCFLPRSSLSSSSSSSSLAEKKKKNTTIFFGKRSPIPRSAREEINSNELTSSEQSRAELSTSVVHFSRPPSASLPPSLRPNNTTCITTTTRKKKRFFSPAHTHTCGSAVDLRCAKLHKKCPNNYCDCHVWILTCFCCKYCT